MDSIAPDARQALDDGDHVRPGLHKLVGDNEAHVARSDHQYTAPRQDPMDVDERLSRPGAHHPRQRPAGKGQSILRSARGQNELLIVQQLTAVTALQG